MVTAIWSLLRSDNDNPPPLSPEPGPATELDCLRGRFAPGLLSAAEAIGRDLGIGADQVLIARGVIGEDAYLRQLAGRTGLAFETFADFDPAGLISGTAAFPWTVRHGLLLFVQDGEVACVVAPRNVSARRLVNWMADRPDLRNRIRLTTTARLMDFVERHGAEPLGRHAEGRLTELYRTMSAAPRKRSGWHRLRRWLSAAGLAAPLTLVPEFPFGAIGDICAIWFLAFIALRAAAALLPTPPRRRLPRQADRALPVYTVIAALYREAPMVDRLMTAINALDYPREKLDVIVVLERDDLETRAAMARLGPMPHVRIVLAPHAGPQTKPKALNYALCFARGSFTTIFDAEDQPAPSQLRAALDTFRAEGPDLACAQASLAINVLDGNWLTRMFAVEYAGHFDAALPGMSAFGLPLPLGGTSNHFRTDLLRKVGGWDAYNVTEDADLGFRLARLGYRTATFDSSTAEDAPDRFDLWVRQRTRWMKGWMQTWSVHMRSPLRLWRETGLHGLIALNVNVGGAILTALAYPVFIVDAILTATSLTLHVPLPFIPDWSFLHLVTAASGILATAIVGCQGLSRRNRLSDARVLIMIPVYWGYLSIAAWRALGQLFFDPYRWEKTEHHASPAPARRQTAHRPAASHRPRQQRAFARHR